VNQVVVERQRREIGWVDKQWRACSPSLDRQRKLLPELPGAMRHRGRRANEPIFARPEGGQPQRQLACPALNATQLGA